MLPTNPTPAPIIFNLAYFYHEISLQIVQIIAIDDMKSITFAEVVYIAGIT